MAINFQQPGGAISSGPITPAIAQQLAMAQRLQEQGASAAPIYNNGGMGWAEGLARVANGLLGGYAQRKATEAQTAERQSYADTLARANQAAQGWVSPDTFQGNNGQTIQAGTVAPGTGGIGAMSSVLSTNPETAPIGMQLATANLEHQRDVTDQRDTQKLGFAHQDTAAKTASDAALNLAKFNRQAMLDAQIQKEGFDSKKPVVVGPDANLVDPLHPDKPLFTGGPRPMKSGPELTPEQIESGGAQHAAGMPLNQIVRGVGAAASAQSQQIREAAIKQIQTETGATPTDAALELVNRSIAFTSGKKSSGQLTTMLGATRQAVEQLDYNVDKAREEMDKLGSSDLSPLINAMARGVEKWTGDPAYTTLYYYMHASATESARLLSGGQASVAQLNQGAAKEAQKWADANYTTPAQWMAVGKAMKDEGRFRVKTYEDALESQKVGAKNPDASITAAPTPASAAPSTVTTQQQFDALPSGAVYTGQDGKPYRKP